MGGSPLLGAIATTIVVFAGCPAGSLLVGPNRPGATAFPTFRRSPPAGPGRWVGSDGRRELLPGPRASREPCLVGTTATIRRYAHRHARHAGPRRGQLSLNRSSHGEKALAHHETSCPSVPARPAVNCSSSMKATITVRSSDYPYAEGDYESGVLGEEPLLMRSRESPFLRTWRTCNRWTGLSRPLTTIS